MRYYAVADVHGFYTPLIKVLKEKGFFEDKEAHKLIVCGDLFDRGREAEELQKFILDLMEKDQVILIKGNHEDLFIRLLEEDKGMPMPHHVRNGTYNTGLQLAQCDDTLSLTNPKTYVDCAKKTPYFTRIIPSMLDYFETAHFIFVHGWLPCVDKGEPKYNRDWRNAGKELWEDARWLNGMDMWNKGVTEKGKTVVCGHIHASYGHCAIEHKCEQFGLDADYTPFVADGIIALDACTAYSGFVNCVIIDD